MRHNPERGNEMRKARWITIAMVVLVTSLALTLPASAQLGFTVDCTGASLVVEDDTYYGYWVAYIPGDGGATYWGGVIEGPSELVIEWPDDTPPPGTTFKWEVWEVGGECYEGQGCLECEPTPPPCEDGCTPGYWKQEQHFDSWVGYAPNDGYGEVFDVVASFDKSLLGALEQGGGGEKALGRHAVAALLNAANPEVGYYYTESDIIGMVQDAYQTGDFEWAKDQLEYQNELGCPLD